MHPALSLCHRELVRFLRQRHRIIGALATPVVFWLLIGAGMGRSFRSDAPGGEHYLHYFFPGTVVMILLFTAIFSTISVIEDRREGFLQGVLVAPVSRTSIVLGKILGGTVLAFGQGVLFLLLAPVIGIRLSLASVALVLVTMFVVAFALTALGLCIAWRMTSTQGFHAVMNLFLMPMWFLSGALFPLAGAWVGLRWVMRLNPLTYGLAALRRAMYLGDASAGAGGAGSAGGVPGLGVSFAVSVAFALVMFVAAWRVATGASRADLE
ncbi:MAG TPA: ABC transporter permease [Tepidisphaeraceae bacterium]|nr:ABC transporter permease [Tepidisphaeraceae bacterium]